MLPCPVERIHARTAFHMPRSQEEETAPPDAAPESAPPQSSQAAEVDLFSEPTPSVEQSWQVRLACFCMLSVLAVDSKLYCLVMLAACGLAAQPLCLAESIKSVESAHNSLNF